jgi:hypothetical protein
MLRQQPKNIFRAALLLGVFSLAIAQAHGDEDNSNMGMEGMEMGGMSMANSQSNGSQMEQGPMSYFRFPDHGGWIYGHIFVMTLGWSVILPVGKNFEYCAE